MLSKKICSLSLILFQPFDLLLACTLSVSTGVNFGNYNPFSAGSNQSAVQVEVGCPQGGASAFTLTLDTGSSGTYTSRTLLSGSYAMNYNLYLNPSYSTIWGDGSSGTGLVSDTLSNCVAVCQYTIYGKIPPNQMSVGVGTYSDIVNAILTF